MTDLISNYLLHPGNPGALINNDVTGMEAYLRAKKNREETESKLQEINTLKEEVADLKNDISDIKNLLLKVLENK